ncbi:hypothetical protein AYO21_11925 [Fonsecaea monophora]|uniref:Uncharacterized protein n=1 Tax=Fonsecaea monophora TaxID=254056 RepID=A0A177EPT5_9EURO|nr:hypothetical protein AYO21_11925 [Fonsecaea monophora]KAH0842393.1 hypothetical protein FOPE_07382 [Fonsecaea pedrosoi]OAG33937.1 hypothetical protein AYO21_11925 [Fonsecaea monophora]
MFAMLTGTVRKRPSSSILLILLLPLLTLVYFRYVVVEQHKTERLVTDLHTYVAEYPLDVALPDFASVANQVAALSQLAGLYMREQTLDRSRLKDSLVHLFPWWNEDKLAYVPWKHSSSKQSKPWSKDKKKPELKTGIVVCVGDGNVEDALFLITNLKKVLKNELPIEIAYAGDSDLSPHTRTFLRATSKDIQFLDLTKIFDNSLIGLKGWATKPFALIASKFPRTILVDADAVFFSNPERAWTDYEGLQETGTLFFHDRAVTMDHSENRRRFVAEQLVRAGRQPSQRLNSSSLFYKGYIGEEADSAVVYFDKSRPELYVTALFAAWMNVQDVRDAITWDTFWGDKESYWLAAELTGVPYAFEPWYAARFSEALSTSEAVVFKTPRICSPHMVHSDADDDEPFWTNMGIWQNKEDKSLGFANWTHWYLGDPIDQTIRTTAAANLTQVPLELDLDLDLEGDGDGDGDPDRVSNATLAQPANETQVLATQASWNWRDWTEDARGCPQHDESRWRPLSREFLERLQSIITEAEHIRYAWTRKKIEMNN